MQIRAVKGIKDILPHDAERWNSIEKTAEKVFSCFGFEEIKIPILEKTQLFVRGIGEATDIVEKEMYTFTDLGGESLTLRPEGTASVVRAYIEHKLFNKLPLTKLYYIGPMFRRERPQAGRYRQFYQIGAEAFGSKSPLMDADVIVMLCTFLENLRINDVEVNINTLGCDICSGKYREALQKFLEKNLYSLCVNCKKRVTVNPLRVLDCKAAECQDIISSSPVTAEYVCIDCRYHHDELKALLSDTGISFKQNNRLVRGLDYYSKTAFEVTTSALGAQDAVAGGGRYDRLVEKFNGPETPAIGFAIGVERLASLLPDNFHPYNKHKIRGFLVSLGNDAYKKSYDICCLLRKNGISVERSYEESSIKSQMRKANRYNVRYTLIYGPDELANNSIIVKDMSSGEQTCVRFDSLSEYIKKTFYHENMGFT